MHAMTADVTTEQPSRLINRLCKHFRHKIEATWDEHEGRLVFSIGECRLVARDQQLTLQCQAPTPGELEELGQVVASHLVRFAGDEVTDVYWQASSA